MLKQEYQIIRNKNTGDETWLLPDTINSINLAQHFIISHYNPLYTLSVIDKLTGQCADIVNQMKSIKSDLSALFCEISTREQSFIRSIGIDSENCRYFVYFDFNQSEIQLPGIYAWDNNCLRIADDIDEKR